MFLRHVYMKSIEPSTPQFYVLGNTDLKLRLVSFYGKVFITVTLFKLFYSEKVKKSTVHNRA